MFSCFCCFTPTLHVILHQYTESEGTGGGVLWWSKQFVSCQQTLCKYDFLQQFMWHGAKLLPMFVSVMLEARDVERGNYSNEVHPLLLKTKLLLLHRFFSLSFLADHHKTFKLGLPSFAFFIYSCFLFDPSHLCTYLFISQFIQQPQTLQIVWLLDTGKHCNRWNVCGASGWS